MFATPQHLLAAAIGDAVARALETGVSSAACVATLQQAHDDLIRAQPLIEAALEFGRSPT